MRVRERWVLEAEYNGRRHKCTKKPGDMEATVRHHQVTLMLRVLTHLCTERGSKTVMEGPRPPIQGKLESKGPEGGVSV